MLKGLIYLIGFQLLGDLITHLTGLPIPGAILGTLLLLLFMMLRGTVDDHLVNISERLLPLLPLFLIPASVGVIAHWPLLKQDGISILIALLAGLIVAFLVTPWLFMLLMRRFARNSQHE